MLAARRTTDTEPVPVVEVARPVMPNIPPELQETGWCETAGEERAATVLDVSGEEGPYTRTPRCRAGRVPRTRAGRHAGAYSASKAALVALVRTIALENKDRCIPANTVLPGTVDTPSNRAADPETDLLQWWQRAKVAALLVHLASDAGAQVTGAAIPIYGRQV